MEKVVNKKPFEVEVDGEKVRLAAQRPTHKVVMDAAVVYNAAFRRAVEGGMMVRARVERVMRDQTLWDDARQAELVRITRTLTEGEKKLARGGGKLSDARQVALEMREARAALRVLMAQRNELDQTTAEAFAEQARFNYLVAACTVYEDTGDPYYRDADEYVGGDNDPVAGPATDAFGKLYYGLDDDFARKLPENAFLLKYKLVNDGLHLVDRQGRLVDELGRLVDDRGRLVNDRGELVAADGTLLEEDGSYKVEFAEFEDDLSEAPVAGVSDVVGPSPEFDAVAERNGQALAGMTTAA